MYSLLCGLWTWLFAREQIRLLLLGLDNAGKTTTLEQLKRHFQLKSLPLHKIVPTVGFNIASLQIRRGAGKGAGMAAEEVNAVLWDLGGSEHVRSIWESYYEEADGVLFVVDSSDRDRLPQAAQCLHYVAGHAKMKARRKDGRRLHQTPILIVANKQDKEGAMTVDEIVSGLALHALGTRGVAGRGGVVQPSQQQRRFSSSGAGGGGGSSQHFSGSSSTSFSSSSSLCTASEQVVNVCPCSSLNDQGLSDALTYLLQAVLLLRRKDASTGDTMEGVIGSPNFRSRSIITYHSRDGHDRHFTGQGQPLGGGGGGVACDPTTAPCKNVLEHHSSSSNMTPSCVSSSSVSAATATNLCIPAIARNTVTTSNNSSEKSSISRSGSGSGTSTFNTVGSSSGVAPSGGMKLGGGGGGGPLGSHHVTPAGTPKGTPYSNFQQAMRSPFNTSVSRGTLGAVRMDEAQFSLPEELFDSPAAAKASEEVRPLAERWRRMKGGGENDDGGETIGGGGGKAGGRYGVVDDRFLDETAALF
eukprot:GHVS01087200.1.p1 GENE.GHVS01087200.1~~GHVS01087200.1.p1  ORF type:complete len:528 (-),score=128.99 GHVS01087200.1:248-1831(-)